MRTEQRAIQKAEVPASWGIAKHPAGKGKCGTCTNGPLLCVLLDTRP